MAFYENDVIATFERASSSHGVTPLENSDDLCLTLFVNSFVRTSEPSVIEAVVFELNVRETFTFE